MKLSTRLSGIQAPATLAITAKAKEMKAKGIEVISLSAGEPDFDVSEPLADGIRRALTDGRSKYTPVPGILELREAIASKLSSENALDYAPNEILVSVGAKQALYNAVMVSVNEGDEVLVPAPYWLSYPAMVTLAGGTSVIVPTRADDGYKIDAARVEEACTDRTRAIIVNSPNNPTGAVYDAENLSRISEIAAKRDLLVISDEIYEKLVFGDARHESIASCKPGGREQTVLINGFSKAYAMPGWRLGYCAGPPEVIAAMAKLQGHSTSNAPSLVQYAVLAALEAGDDSFKVMRKAFAKRRDFLCKGLESIDGITAPLPEGAFYILADCKARLPGRLGGSRIASSADLALHLLEKGGVATVPGEEFGAPGTLRLSYAASLEDLARALEKMENFFASLEKA
ncbi:MAG: pyridoxal phosphate-dependent aminotransferase [Planctomycetota bacterium]|jgi:aspartate aminotransferase